MYSVVQVQLHTFLTSALHESVWSASHPDHFNPRKRKMVHTGEEAGMAPQPTWMQWQREKIPARK